jgi:citrate lyase subunit beta / citryl-CoA lyase
VTAAPARSWLYVPAHRTELAAKALGGDADGVVLDLEDAVPKERKREARAATARVVEDGAGKPVRVRINPLASGHGRDDLAAVASPCVDAVRLPKAESPAEVDEVADLLERAGANPRVECLIESPLGLERAFELASHPAVIAIGLGEADLSASLGVEGEDGLLYARSRCVAAARAAGLPPPVPSGFPPIGDQDGLRRTTELGRRLGFFGRSAIHPRQLPAIHEVFTPTSDEVERARALVEALEEAEDRGAGATALPDGRFVDPAVAEASRRTLALADQLSRTVPR